MIAPMRLPSTLAWLVDEAGTVRGADQFLATLGAKLIAEETAAATRADQDGFHFLIAL